MLFTPVNKFVPDVLDHMWAGGSQAGNKLAPDCMQAGGTSGCMLAPDWTRWVFPLKLLPTLTQGYFLGIQVWT